MFFSPLEQFQILPFFSFGIALFDFSITNAMITTFLGLGFFLFVHYCISVYSFSCFPNRWQLLIEGLYLTTAGLIWDNQPPKKHLTLQILHVFYLKNFLHH